jgi:hypothetical protein
MAWQGEWASLFGKWGKDRDARRLEALLTFADAIVGSTMEPVAFCGDSNEIRQKAFDAKRPDVLMLEMAVVSATQALPPNDSISLLLDWEEGFDELCCRLFRKPRAESVLNSDRIILLGFGDDKAHAELQAADMLAWLSCKELERRIRHPNDTVDPVYQRLTSVHAPVVKRVPSVGLYGADALRRMVESHASSSKARGAGRH